MLSCQKRGSEDEAHRWKPCSVFVDRQTLYGISLATSVVAVVNIVEGRSIFRLRSLGKLRTCASHDGRFEFEKIHDNVE